VQGLTEMERGATSTSMQGKVQERVDPGVSISTIFSAPCQKEENDHGG